MIDRLLRAAQLHLDLYEEVNRDPQARVQAMAAVALAAVAAGIGGGLRVGGSNGDFYVAVLGLILGVVGYLAGWVVFVWTAYYLSTRVFRLAPRMEMTRDQLLSTTGFAQAPAIFSFFCFLPLIGAPLQLIIFGWVGVAAAMAATEALRTDMARVAKVVVPGALAQVIVYFMLLRLSVPVTDLLV